MIDVVRYRKLLEDRFLMANFVKLDKPVNTKECFYVGTCVDEVIDFDTGFWNPSVISLLRTMTEAGINGFYRLDVRYGDGNVLWITASRGDTNGQLP